MLGLTCSLMFLENSEVPLQRGKIKKKVEYSILVHIGIVNEQVKYSLKL